MTPNTASSNANRRPLKSRDHPLAKHLAAWLVTKKVNPDTISVFSIVFAGVGAVSLYWSAVPWALLACALGIQLRLACNLLDGMVAIEGGRQSAIGALYNEIPDRIADSLLIVALGYAIGLPGLGWP